MEGCVGAPLKATWAHEIWCFSCWNFANEAAWICLGEPLRRGAHSHFSHFFHRFRRCNIRNLPKDGSKFLAHDGAVESTSPSKILPIRRLIQPTQACGIQEGLAKDAFLDLIFTVFGDFFFQWLLTSIPFWLKTQDQSFSHCYIMDTAYFSSPGPRLHWHRSLSLNPGSLESRNYQYKNDFQHL